MSLEIALKIDEIAHLLFKLMSDVPFDDLHENTVTLEQMIADNTPFQCTEPVFAVSVARALINAGIPQSQVSVVQGERYGKMTYAVAYDDGSGRILEMGSTSQNGFNGMAYQAPRHILSSTATYYMSMDPITLGHRPMFYETAPVEESTNLQDVNVLRGLVNYSDDVDQVEVAELAEHVLNAESDEQGADMGLFVSDWKELLTKAYSIWGSWALIVLVLAPDALFYGLGIDTNPVVWGRLIIITAVLSVIGRLLNQPDRDKWKRRIVLVFVVLAVAAVSVPAMAHDTASCNAAPTADEEMEHTVTLVKRWEGRKMKGEFHIGYLDIVKVATACWGHTETAVVGKLYTEAECEALLTADLQTYRNGVRSAFTQKTQSERLTPRRSAAFNSLSYNIGISAVKKSTAVRRTNAGDIKGGCTALTWFTYAGGRRVRGLINRRNAEYKYCMQGLI